MDLICRKNTKTLTKGKKYKGELTDWTMMGGDYHKSFIVHPNDKGKKKKYSTNLFKKPKIK